MREVPATPPPRAQLRHDRAAPPIHWLTYPYGIRASGPGAAEEQGPLSGVVIVRIHLCVSTTVPRKPVQTKLREIRVRGSIGRRECSAFGNIVTSISVQEDGLAGIRATSSAPDNAVHLLPLSTIANGSPPWHRRGSRCIARPESSARRWSNAAYPTSESPSQATRKRRRCGLWPNALGISQFAVRRRRNRQGTSCSSYHLVEQP